MAYTQRLKELQEAARQAALLLTEVAPGTAGQAYVARSSLAKLEAAVIAAGFNVPAYRKQYRKAMQEEIKRKNAQRDADAVAKFPSGTRVMIALYSQPHPSNPPRCTIGVVSVSNRKLKRDQVYVMWDGYSPSPISAYSLERL